MKPERRYFSSEQNDYRAIEEDGQRIIEGYAAVYDTRSRLLFENGDLFYEQIERGAFDEVVASNELDVIYNFQHDDDRIMARTTSGTLTLKADDKGLFFRAVIDPEISEAKDLWLRIKRGDISENSFAFYVNANDYRFEDVEGEDIPLRRISRIAGLFDVSSVTRAAYPTTSVEAREWKKEDVENAEQEEERAEQDKAKEQEQLLLRIRI